MRFEDISKAKELMDEITRLQGQVNSIQGFQVERIQFITDKPNDPDHVPAKQETRELFRKTPCIDPFATYHLTEEQCINLKRDIISSIQGVITLKLKSLKVLGVDVI